LAPAQIETTWIRRLLARQDENSVLSLYRRAIIPKNEENLQHAEDQKQPRRRETIQTNRDRKVRLQQIAWQPHSDDEDKETKAIFAKDRGHAQNQRENRETSFAL
jgi:hypothetical protein